MEEVLTFLHAIWQFCSYLFWPQQRIVASGMLTVEEMRTFSAICDEFVKAEGFEKKQCANDAEAVAYAAGMGYDSETYPVVYFGSDTTGEKAYEEFYVPGEKIDMARFRICPREGMYGIQVPKMAWHTLEVHEPSTIFEAKDGRYGK